MQSAWRCHKETHNYYRNIRSSASMRTDSISFSFFTVCHWCFICGFCSPLTSLHAGRLGTSKPDAQIVFCVLQNTTVQTHLFEMYPEKQTEWGRHVLQGHCTSRCAAGLGKRLSLCLARSWKAYLCVEKKFARWREIWARSERLIKLPSQAISGYTPGAQRGIEGRRWMLRERERDVKRDSWEWKSVFQS